MAFLIAEDEALKAHISGLTVQDYGTGTERRVKVWFRYPEAEEREITYPFLSIDLIDVDENEEFAHRGSMTPGYLPYDVPPPPAGSSYVTEWPTPVTLTYQITSYARSSWHDRQLTAKIHELIPFRMGALHVPADNTVRTMQLVDSASFDGQDQNNIRVFRKAYTVTVASELFQSALMLVSRPTEVEIDVIPHFDTTPLIVDQSSSNSES